MRADELATLYRLTDALYRASGYPDIYDAALDAITAVLGSRASILLFDEAGVMRFVAWRGLSEDYRRKLEGHSPWKPGDIAPEPIFVEDIEETQEPPAVKSTILTEGIRGLAFIPLLSRQRVIGKFMTYYGEAHRFAENETNLAVTIARQLGFSIERARADGALRESEERFRLMSEQAPVMLWLSDADGACLQLNHQLRDFWGVHKDRVAEFDWRVSMHPEDRERITRTMADALALRRSVALEGRYRNAEGQYRLLSTSANPRFSKGGEFLGMIGVNVDITQQREAEERLKLLLAELNHRVKNTLAVVQAIAHQTFRGHGTGSEPRKAFEGRLIALATAHNLLTQSNWESASLRAIATDALNSQGVDPKRASLAGPHVELTPKQALALALALHELCTNATKYGALSNDAGRIAIAWDREAERGLKISWTEQLGPPVAPPGRRGFGSRLIEQSLARDLDARVVLDFRPEGVCCTIDAATAGLRPELA
jgi:PAS domain S-box-containing protein